MEATTTKTQHNYVEIATRWPFSRRFMYFDVRPYKADEIFVEMGIVPLFEQEMVSDNSPYVIVICRVSQKDAHKFELVMDKLGNKMLLTGYNDYLDYCDGMLSEIFNEMDRSSNG